MSRDTSGVMSAAERLRTWSQHPRQVASGSLVAGWAVFFAPQLWSDGVPYFRDALLTYYPILVYLRERLRRGEMPQWFPYEGLGSPFIGQVVTQTFYPITYLLLPFSAATALKIIVLGAYLIALFGAYRWARCFTSGRVAAVAGAFAYALGGYALSMSSNPNYLLGVATLPWVAWAAWRLAARPRHQGVVLLGVSWAMLFLSGDVQTFLISAALPLLALIWFRPNVQRIVAFGTSVALTTALIAAELIPAWLIDRTSLRTLGTPLPTRGLVWATHPARLLELVLGGFVPDTARYAMAHALSGGPSSFWAMSLFAGTTVLCLSAVGALTGGRRAMVGMALVIGGVWLALGDRGCLLPIIWRLAPPTAHFRFPEKYLVFVWLGLCPLVGLGTQALRTRRVIALTVSLASALALLGVFALASRVNAVAVLWGVVGRDLPRQSELGEIVNATWARAALYGAGFAAALGIVAWRSGSERALHRVIPGLILIELLRVNGPQLPLVDRSLLEKPLPIYAAVAASGMAPPHRVIRSSRQPLPALVTAENSEWVVRARVSALPNAGAIQRIPGFGLELPAESARYALVFGPSGQLQETKGPAFDGCFRLLDLGAPAPKGAERVGVEPALGYALWSTPCIPRAYLSAVTSAANLWAAARMLAHSSDASAVWENGPVLPDAGGTIRWASSAPEHLAFDIVAPSTTALVVNDLYSPGWRALVDRQPSPIHPTNVVARGVEIPAGAHHVELLYRAPGLRYGLALSVIGWLWVWTSLAAGGWRSRRSGAQRGRPGSTA